MHTPGPWAIKYRGKQAWIETDYSLCRVADVILWYKPSAELIAEHNANASLISAAPDLLEALEALSKSAPSACCVDFHHQPGDYHAADESCPALDRYEAACLSARAAIAKARGETK